MFYPPLPPQATQHDHYLPCEIAISKYSLREGVHRVLHGFIQPISIPSGYSYEIMENGKATHTLDDTSRPLKTQSAKSYRQIVNMIQDLIRSESGTPQIFTLEVKSDQLITIFKDPQGLTLALI